jgi:PAS domain S-box-containing protein
LPQLGGGFYQQLFERCSERLVVLEVSSDARPVRFLAVSDEACDLLGATREEILALSPADLRIDPLDDCDVQSDLLAGEKVRLATTLAGKNGHSFEVEVIARLAQLDGRICLIASARDAAIGARLAEAMRDQQGQIKRAELLARFGTVKWDVGTDEHIWSDGFYRLIGFEPGSVPCGLDTFLPAVHPDDREVVTRSIATAFETQAYVESEVRVVWPDGSVHFVRGRMTVEPGASGQPEVFYLAVQDITEERLATDALRKSEEGLAAAQKLARIGSIDWDLESREGTWSDEYYRILGLQPGEVEPGLKTYLEFVHEDDRDFVRNGLAEMQKTGEGRTADVRIVSKDGRDKIVTASTDLICDDSGKPVRQFSTIQDVTELKKLQEQRRIDEAFLLKAQEIAHLGSWVVDLSSGKVTWSDELYRICGIEQKDWDGTVESYLRDICHPDDIDLAAEVLRSLTETLRTPEAEYRILRPDGVARLLLTRGEAVFDDAGKATSIVGVSWDVTDIRAAEEALRRSEERFELATAGSTDGLWDWPDTSTPDYWVSARCAALLGYDVADFPSSTTVVKDVIHPLDLQRVSERLQAHLKHDEPYDVEMRMRRRDGAYRWYRVRGRASRDDDGRAVRVSGSLLDIDDGKRADEKLVLYQEQLQWLAEGVSKAAERERRRIGAELHDRTIQSLGFLRVKLGELRAGLASGNGAPGLIDEIVGLTEGTIQETRALLQELSPPVLYELGFEPAVEWLAERAEQLYGFECRVDCRGAGAELGDDSEVVLFQAVRELLANAGRHAAAANLEVSVRRERDELVVRVTDDGVGFSAEAVELPPNENGGFGLFSIRERMKVLGGALEIYSEPQDGTRIVLRLPVGEVDECSTG